MAKQLADFLEDLDTDARIKAMYMNDPVETAKSYGLSGEDISTIENKDWKAVSQRFEDLSKSPKNVDYNH